jgi:D-arabinose 5-phosphate isomerase GutQ
MQLLNTIRIEELLSSVVFLAALSFVLVFSGTSAAYGVVSPGNLIIAQAGSGDGSIIVNVADSCTYQHVPGVIVTVGEQQYVTNTYGSTAFTVLPSGSVTIGLSHSGYYSTSLLTASSTYTAVYTIYLVPLKPCYP